MKSCSYLALPLFLLVGQALTAQKTEAPEIYKFYKTNDKVVEVKTGEWLDVTFERTDTVFNYYGLLQSKSDSSVTLCCYYEDIEYYSYDGRRDISYSSNYHSTEEEQIEISAPELRLSKQPKLHWIGGIGGVLMVTSMYSAILIAPLVSLDQDAPRNFNVSRYSEILKYSAWAFGAGLVLMPFTGEVKLKLATG